MTYVGEGLFHCDECPEHIETNESDFTAALERAKRHGWRGFVGPDKKYAHACPVCVADWKEKRR